MPSMTNAIVITSTTQLTSYNSTTPGPPSRDINVSYFERRSLAPPPSMTVVSRFLSLSR